MSFVIGIDLGTTYSCVGVWIKNKVEIIHNDIGKKTTPSHVAFDNEGTVLIGETAKHQADIHPEFSIFDVKRLIGRRFDDPIVQKDIKNWSFQVIEGKKDTPMIKLPNGKNFLPEQISAKLLSYLKKQAEEYLSTEVKNAVITVPAYFNDGQRQATRDAGAIAGLNVLQIINEPTAAAIAYNFQRNSPDLKTILVFDLGGGTFDVSILRMQGKDIEVLGVGGDTHLGGEDFDNAMLEYCIEEFQEKEGVDLNKGKNSSDEMERMKANMRLRRLKNECEKEKIHLSAAKSVYISLDAFFNGKNLHVQINRETFESINKEAFDKCLGKMEEVIKDAKLTKSNIDDVILVGGSSKIPAIQEMITVCYGKKPLKNIRGDEAVAYGAALQARKFSTEKGSDSTDTSYFNIKDVYPLTVGIKVHANGREENNFSPIIPKNTSVPCKKTQRYATVSDNQKTVSISIYEGEDTSVRKNYLLGTFVVNNLPMNCPKDEPIDVTMEFNAEGILHCTAICPRNDATNKIEVIETKGRLTYEDIQRMKMEVLTEQLLRFRKCTFTRRFHPNEVDCV